MKTKTYYLIITIFALIGVALLFSNYPIVIAIASFGFGISFREYTQEEVKEVEEDAVISCSCNDGIIVCPGCNGEQLISGVCAGCKGTGIRTCGKCGGN